MDEFIGILNLEKSLLDTYAKHLPSLPVGYRHFYLCGVARRALAQSRAFRSCLEDRNALVAFAILRLQLDTVMRLYALYWVEDPEDFAREVFQGKQVDRMKAADGKVMKDRYLLDKLVPANAWVESVYRNTSGLIHFSDRHIMAALRVRDGVEGSFELHLGPNDPSHGEEDFKEAISAFCHIMQMIQVAVDDWFERVEQVQGEASSRTSDLSASGEKETP